MLRPLASRIASWQPKGRVPGDPLGVASSVWGALVGDQLAQATRPIAINGDTLIVATQSSVWSEHLAFLEPQILAGLHEHEPTRSLARVRFRTSRNASERRPAARAQAGGGGTRTPPHAPSAVRPAATLEEALDRLRQHVTAAQQAKLTRGWKCCVSCKVALSRGTLCAPCTAARDERRAQTVHRILYEAPWLGYAGTAAVVEGLTRDEYERERREALARWSTTLARVKQSGQLAPDLRERRIASSYVILHTGRAPEDITPAIVRNLLGDELHALLYHDDR